MGASKDFREMSIALRESKQQFSQLVQALEPGQLQQMWDDDKLDAETFGRAHRIRVGCQMEP